MRKAIIEVQFNWIFILIVGAIILAFFVGIVVKQKEISIKKTGVQLAFDLETITTGAEVSKGTSQTIDIPNLGITFSSRDCIRKYTIGGGSKLYREKVIFAPTRIEGSRLLAWTLSWDMPFRITNFLLLTSPGMRYIIVAPTGNPEARMFAKLMNKTIPESIFKEIIDQDKVANIKDYKNYKVRFVFFTDSFDPPPVLNYMKDTDVTALRIDDLRNGGERANLTFYRKKKSGNVYVFDKLGTTYALGVPSLYGAFFADDLETYQCNMMEAFNKMYFVSKLVQNRTYMLYTEPALATSVCSADYSASIEALMNMHKNASRLSKEFLEGYTYSMTNDVYDLAYDPDTGLSRHNGNLLLHSCPVIY